VITNLYVDGFNLFYGALRRSPYRWLDLGALARVLLPQDEIHRIRYFTARITNRPDDPGKAQRQDVYLRALRTIPNLTLHYGHHLTFTIRMPLANPLPGGPRTVEVIRTEEKGSDVNLATCLLVDAFRRDCQAALVVSNDSDLKEPIAVARQEFGLVVGVVNPHPAGRRSRALRPTFFKQLRPSAPGQDTVPRRP
jgi:NYN domain-containing protein